jgi:DMSO/TMAO reductase YedYZ molybdopterin-dependent catalytic subunit
VLSPDREIVLVGDPAVALEAKVRLARIGYDRVVGQLQDAAQVFSARQDLIETSSRLTIEQLAELRGLEPGLQVVDVRAPAETAGGTLPGAREIPLPALSDSLAGLDPSSPIVVYCASGYRSEVAASVLVEAGFADVADLLGGYQGWEAAGLPISTPGALTEVAGTPQVSTRAAQRLVEAGALLLDVRELDEWRTGHAPGATLMPMASVQDRRTELPRDRRIVVMCRSGGRSAAVTDSLLAANFDAVNLAGGICAWSAAGLPVTNEADAGLVVHRTSPLNCETSIPALIGGVVMPNARFYVRNHFVTPALDAMTWRLEVGGLVERPQSFSLRDLRNMRSHTVVATLECAGNGRSMLNPPAAGEQWQLGAVSTAEWTGVPLVELLDRVGPTARASEVVFRGADQGQVDGVEETVSFERSLSLDDVRGADALVTYAMNGEPLPVEHGYPVRLIVPDWYAVASVKWLTRIDFVPSPFQGFFQAQHYVYERQRDGRTEREPVRLQQVRSVITEPTPHDDVAVGDLVIRGVAWSGAAPIAKVEVRVGDGAWQPAQLIGDRARHSWQWWELLCRLDEPGPTTVRARATDLAGRTQPDQPDWNRLGYGANAVQVVPIRLR